MPNQHAVSLGATPLAIPSTAEIVVLTMTPFSENQSAGTFQQSQVGANPNPGPQGVVLDANMNVTGTTGTLTLRLRYGSLTGGLVVGSVATVSTIATGIAIYASAFALDTTLVQTNVVYVLTAQLGAGTGTVNAAVFSAQDATSFE